MGICLVTCQMLSHLEERKRELVKIKIQAKAKIYPIFLNPDTIIMPITITECLIVPLSPWILSLKLDWHTKMYYDQYYTDKNLRLRKNKEFAWASELSTRVRIQPSSDPGWSSYPCCMPSLLSLANPQLADHPPNLPQAIVTGQEAVSSVTLQIQLFKEASFTIIIYFSCKDIS